jgi:type IV pilus secretin PilQ/predicted competence protein
MKIRFARFSSFASSTTRDSHWGILLFLLVFMVSTIGTAGETPKNSKSDQPQSNPAPLTKNNTAGNPAKEVSGGTSAAKTPVGVIKDATITPEDDKLTVTLATDRLLAPKEFRLANPPRLVLDFPNTESRTKFTKLPVNALAVKQLRVHQFESSDPKIARVVFDLEEGSGAHEISVDPSHVRVVFHPGKAQTKAIQEAQPVKAATQAADGAPKAESTDARMGKVVALPDLPKTAPPANQPKQQELRIKESEAPAPLIASLAPVIPPAAARASVAPPAPPRPTSSSDSRFSGKPLTLDLIDLPLVDFFRLMAVEGGINIVLDPDVKGNISIMMEKVPWDQIFESVLATRGLDKQVEGTLVRVTRKATLQDEAKQREALKKANLLAADLETRIKRLNYAKAGSLIPVLADQKTVRGTVVLDERTNSLIITDLPSSLDKISQLIDSLDIAQAQVEIEARIVSATRDFARDIGIQFGFVAGNLQRITVGGPNTFGTIGGTRPSATPTSTFAAGTATGRGAADSSSSESAAVSTGTTSNQKGNYNVNLPANKAYGGAGISIGNIFDTFLLDAAVTAGESKGVAKLISQPKVTAQNNSPAVITQGLRFPVQVVANNTITIQFQNAALTLTVTPQITYEGNIVLDLKVENNTPDFSLQVNGVPSIRTSESTTRVLVSDGGTTVIGGILTDSESTQGDKIPGLGSLPFVGYLFRRSAVARNTQEVLFFVTPRIVK